MKEEIFKIIGNSHINKLPIFYNYFEEFEKASFIVLATNKEHFTDHFICERPFIPICRCTI